MKKSRYLAAFLCLVLLSGCTQQTTAQVSTAQEEAVIITSMEQEAVLAYEVPENIPGILVNQLGYRPGSSKVAVFKGEEIPEVFYVINAETKAAVFTGRTEEKKYDNYQKEYYSYGDFSELKTEGTYYIEAPVLGYSYSFRIEDNVYDTVFAEACKQYYYSRCGMTLTEEYAGSAAHNACHIGKAALLEDISVTMDVTGGWHQDEKGQKNVVAASETVSAILLAYELYGEAFLDDVGIPESGNGVPDILDEIKYEIEWLLKMQDKQTGAVYAGISIYTPGEDASGKSSEIYVEPASAEAERAFAMALAKFSYLYQAYDTEYATICLKAADRAYKHSVMHEDVHPDHYSFAAAAELYRAAGQQSFHWDMLEYLKKEENLSVREEAALFGCVTYLSTKNPVNKEQCEKIMSMLMEEAEEISARSKSSLYLAAGNQKQDNNSELLFDMMYMTVVNHIISNHEYETVMENHLHYFLGRNAQAVCYIENAGERSSHEVEGARGIMKQFDANSKLIFMLSEIVVRENH